MRREVKNEYCHTDVHWSEVPGRDEKWRQQTIANTSEQQFKVEFECEFLGSVDTLIAPSKLRTLVYESPKTQGAGLDVYEDPQEKLSLIHISEPTRRYAIWDGGVGG